MKPKGIISDLVGLFGISMALIPWLTFDKPGFGAIIMTCIGAIFVGVSRADSQSDMLGRGNPGDDLVFSIARWIKSKLKKK